MCFKYFAIIILIALIDKSLATNSTDLIVDNLNWSCANNASCVRAVSSEILNRLKNRKPIRIGEFSIEPIETTTFDGRSWSLINFLNGNALRIPLGPMMLSVQRSNEYQNYIEVALLKKAQDSGRHGAGEGGGHSENIHSAIRDRKEKKHFQAYIPMFLAFNAVGWMMLAMKAVTMLTMKALFVSKLAFVVASTVVIKKMMDSATEKMMASHHFEHPEPPMMMPYNMEYAIPSHPYHPGSEMAGNELYSIQMPASHDAIGHHQEAMAAESTLSQAVNLHNVTNGQSLVGLQAVPKVKRQDRDVWTGFRRRPTVYNYLTARKPIQAFRK